MRLTLTKLNFYGLKIRAPQTKFFEKISHEFFIQKLNS